MLRGAHGFNQKPSYTLTDDWYKTITYWQACKALDSSYTTLEEGYRYTDDSNGCRFAHDLTQPKAIWIQEYRHITLPLLSTWLRLANPLPGGSMSHSNCSLPLMVINVVGVLPVTKISPLSPSASIILKVAPHVLVAGCCCQKAALKPCSSHCCWSE